MKDTGFSDLYDMLVITEPACVRGEIWTCFNLSLVLTCWATPFTHTEYLSPVEVGSTWSVQINTEEGRPADWAVYAVFHGSVYLSLFDRIPSHLTFRSMLWGGG